MILKIVCTISLTWQAAVAVHINVARGVATSDQIGQVVFPCNYTPDDRNHSANIKWECRGEIVVVKHSLGQVFSGRNYTGRVDMGMGCSLVLHNPRPSDTNLYTVRIIVPRDKHKVERQDVLFVVSDSLRIPQTSTQRSLEMPTSNDVSITTEAIVRWSTYNTYHLVLFVFVIFYGAVRLVINCVSLCKNARSGRISVAVMRSRKTSLWWKLTLVSTPVLLLVGTVMCMIGVIHMDWIVSRRNAGPTRQMPLSDIQEPIPGTSWMDPEAQTSEGIASTDQAISKSVLRLRKRKASQPDITDTNTTREYAKGACLINIEIMVCIWNAVILDHSKAGEECQLPTFEVASEKKWGLEWSYNFKCVACDYVSGMHKFYKEVKSTRPGPNPDGVNLALQVGLQDTPLGNTRARLLLASMDIPPPTTRTMQRTANKVGSTTEKMNTADMTRKVEEVREYKRQRGENDNTIDLATDARYNSITKASSKKPGQNASQAIALGIETTTEKNYMVSASIQNKLCWTGSWLRGKGFDVKCPGGHAECTANTNPHAPWSEYTMGKEMGESLAKQGVLVEHVTTDGDSRSAKGVEDGVRMVEPLWEVERLADPTHLGRSQFRRCQRAQFSEGMFTQWTREARRRAQKVLSQDVKARCSLIFSSLMDEHGGDIGKVKAWLPRVVDATIWCYGVTVRDVDGTVWCAQED